MSAETRSQTGFYCSTSGTYFNDKESLAEHYKSDFHRYNLKRKVAGLPPVTKEWFDARKEQLAQVTPSESVQRVWIDPLTKKKFSSENTYQAHIRSKKYQDLLRKTGQPAPEPILVTKTVQDKGPEVQKQLLAEANKTAGYVMKSASKSFPSAQATQPAAPQDDSVASDESGDEVAALEGSDWETASEDEVDTSSEAEWDVTRSFFDNHLSSSLEANLEYMYRNFGFYLPDAECLVDPEGLLKYLGAKLSQGHIPLYISGNNPNAKRFRSLHGVQRHMVDTQQCRMCYEDNEEEYEDFYDYTALNAQEEGEGQQVVLAGGDSPVSLAVAGYELVVAQGERSERVLGSRELARYYKQRHKPEDMRLSVAINKVLAKYRALAISTREEHSSAKAAQVRISRKGQMRLDRNLVRTQVWSNKVKDLPQYVPY